MFYLHGFCNVCVHSFLYCVTFSLLSSLILHHLPLSSTFLSLFIFIFLSECENIFLVCFFSVLFTCLLFFFFSAINVLFFLSHFTFYWNNLSYLILFINWLFESNFMFIFFLSFFFFFNFTVIELTFSCLLLKSEYLRN